MFNYKKLIVWQKSMDLIEKVYVLIKILPARMLGSMLKKYGTIHCSTSTLAFD